MPLFFLLFLITFNVQANEPSTLQTPPLIHIEDPSKNHISPPSWTVVESYYSSFVDKLQHNWASKKPLSPFELQESFPVKIRGLSTPQSELYVGIEQYMEIEASLESVSSILQDFLQYH